MVILVSHFGSGLGDQAIALHLLGRLALGLGDALGLQALGFGLALGLQAQRLGFVERATNVYRFEF